MKYVTLISITFLASYVGFNLLALFLFFIILYLWDLDKLEAVCKEAREKEEKEVNEWNASQERKYIKAEKEWQEEQLRIKYSEIGYGREDKQSLFRRLSYHDRTGYATELEKELLEILAIELKPQDYTQAL